MACISFCELLKNWKQTLLMALQIGLIMFLTVVAVTIYREQTVRYRYIKDYLHKDGMVLSVDGSEINNAGGAEEYFEGFGIDEYHHVTQFQLFLDIKWEKYFYGYAYDEFLSRYEPKLSEGVWFTKAPKTEGVIEGVISKKTFDAKLGDTVELSYYGDTIKVHICGILDEETSIFGAIDGFSVYDSFFDLYRNFNSEREDTEVLILLSLEDLEEALGYHPTPWGIVLATFKEDLSEAEKEKKLSDLKKSSILIDFATLRGRTESEINSKMAEIMPIFIGAFFLVVLSITSMSAVDTMTSLQSYAVFFACGMKWKKGMYINALKSIMTCFIGAVVMFLLYYISILTKLNETILFELGPWQILSCVLVCLFMVIVSCIMPRQILKNNQPAEVLRESRQ